MKFNNNLKYNITMDVCDEDLLDDWFIRRSISKGTQKSYRIALRYFINLLNKNPNDLIEEAEIEEDSGIRLRRRKVYRYLLRYKKYLEDSHIAPSTTHLYFSAIKSFYKAFDITVPEIKIKRGDIELERNHGKPLTRKDIHKLIGVASPREKALIYLIAMSGMGQQEARDLTIKKLLDSASIEIGMELDDVYDLFKFEEEILSKILILEITRKKVNYKHHTFLPPEATREIINYLKERCYGKNKKICVKGNNDFIFVNIYGSKLSRDSIVTNFRYLGEKVGLKREKNSYSYWRSHALRKYFISKIINKIGDTTVADYLAGHKINDQDRTYWKADPQDLKNHYKKALPHLSIDEAKVKDVESDEFKEYIEKSKEKEETIKALVDEMAEMKRRNQVRDELLDKIITEKHVVEELENKQ